MTTIGTHRLTGALFATFALSGFAFGADDKAAERAPAQSRWIHDDIEKGYARARASGKPLLVAFR